MRGDDVKKEIELIWASLLGVEHVLETDNFLLLGGESLLATMATARVRESLGYELSIRAIFTKTVGEIALEISEGRAMTSRADSSECVDKSMPPSMTKMEI